ncbi:MAG: xanthine dehydrogenase family protein molybdopterin-binding subunit [Halobacteriales archaeon]
MSSRSEAVQDRATETSEETRGRRREDAALLAGRARFTADRFPDEAVHLAFVRSPVAHGDVVEVRTDRAEALDGVVAAYAWAAVERSAAPGRIPVASERLDAAPPGHPILADGRVRYHGQPVAAVVAETPYRARDAAEAVEVTVEDRRPVTDPRRAREAGAPRLFEAVPGNVVLTSSLGDPDEARAAIDAADHAVDLELGNNRLAPTALEPRAALAELDGDQLVVTMTSQAPHSHRRKLAGTLGLAQKDVRVVAPAVGGGFGHKGHHHPGEAMAAWAALELDRPVAWRATRRGNYLAGAHGRDHRTAATLGVDADGTIRGLAVETDAAVGAYGLGVSPLMPGWYGRLLAGQYAIDAIGCTTRAVLTTTAPVHSYRGAGRPEAIYVVERLVDVAASELGIDPAALRRRNLVPDAAFPHETPVGATYDSGRYEAAMTRALELVGYDRLRERQAADTGRTIGVGLANYVESTGAGIESATVRVHPDGTVTAYVGTHDHGQGHGTTYANLVADALPVDAEAVAVVEGDTERIPRGTGTFGSRSAVTGGNAVAEAAAAVRERARRLAAHRLGVDVGAVRETDAGFAAGDEVVGFEAVARAAYGADRPEGLEPGLERTTFYESPGTAYTFGTHVAVVAVDHETGAVDLRRYVAVDDCGERLEPTIVEGQVHGGVAQGIGQARLERVVYDDEGRLVTDAMPAYGVPRATQLPPIETGATVTPSPLNDLGVKGIGEAGTIAAPPAVVNAVVDALAPRGVRHLDMPVTDETVWQALGG